MLCGKRVVFLKGKAVFTGIIETTGKIVETREVAGGRRLRIQAGIVAQDAKPGASISVSGVCLTVVEMTDQELSFEVISETLDRSTLGDKRQGDRVNLERSLRVGDRLDGHFVQGHIDGTARVERVITSSREHVVWFRPDVSLRPYIIPKGAIAIDGVSLTIAEVRGDTFSVALIPTTLSLTTFAQLPAGCRVNLETDIVARTIVHRLSQLLAEGALPTGGRKGLSEELLKEIGVV
jgi:riboflavin synthase